MKKSATYQWLGLGIFAACIGLGGTSYYLNQSANKLPVPAGVSSEALDSDVELASIHTSGANSSGVNNSDSKGNTQATIIIKPVKYGDYESIHGPLPKSLEGAPLPTGLSVDSDGHLIPTQALQRLFDFFLTTVGEEPLDLVVKRIQEYLAGQLDEPASLEAIGVLETYLVMKEAMMTMEAEWSEAVSLGQKRPSFKEVFERKKALRLEHLGEEVYDAFYQRDEQLDQYTLKKLDILKDESLTESEKQQQLQQVEQLLPEDVQQKKAQQRALDTLEQDIEVARSQGASDTEIYQMRLEVMGVEKADRFQRADLSKRSWDKRVSEYRSQRNQILNSTLSEQDKQSQIQALREANFSGRELLRIPVIDRMKDQQETLN